MRSAEHLALCILLSVLAVGTTPCASIADEKKAEDDKHQPLSGHVEHDQLPSRRLERPQLKSSAQATELKGQATSLDASSFDLNAKKTTTLQGIDDQINATTTALFGKEDTNKQAPAQTKSYIAVPEAAPTGKAKVDDLPTDQLSLQDKLDILKKKYVVILLDRSGSMATPDCDGETRWNWCKQESEHFSSLTESIMPDGFDLVLFATGFKDFGHRNAYSLAEVFQQNTPSGATLISGAIKFISERYCVQHSNGLDKTLLIAVITDGLPQDFNELKKQITMITHQMHNFDEIKITFLRVGNDDEGERFIKTLDDDLMGKGADYDIVDSKTFAELQREGLMDCLIDAVREHKDRYN